MDLLLSAAQQHGIALPVNVGIKQIYDTASARGIGERDFFVLVREVEIAAGAESD